MRSDALSTRLWGLGKLALAVALSFIAYLVGMSLCGFFLILAADAVGEPVFGWGSRWWGPWVSMGLVFSPGAVLGLWVYDKLTAEMTGRLRRPCPRCRACSRLLRNLVAPKCPACGAAL